MLFVIMLLTGCQPDLESVSKEVIASPAFQGAVDAAVAKAMSATPTRSEGTEVNDCTDRADNDGDGDFDCLDKGCAKQPDCLEVKRVKEAKRCENAVAWACDYIGDHERAAGLFESECENGKARSCFRFGTMLEEGLGVRQDTARGESLHKKACGMDGISCTESGEMVDSNSALHRL